MFSIFIVENAFDICMAAARMATRQWHLWHCRSQEISDQYTKEENDGNNEREREIRPKIQ